MQLQLQITQMQSIQTPTAGQTPCVYPYSLITTQPNISYVHLYFSFFNSDGTRQRLSYIYISIYARKIYLYRIKYSFRQIIFCMFCVYMYLQSEPPTKMDNSRNVLLFFIA